MKLIVGLGNPGGEYEGTWHNVGFMLVEAFGIKISKSDYRILKQGEAERFNYQKKFQADICREGEVLLMKPQTFMNKSGEAVRRVVDFYGEQLTPEYAPGGTRSQDFSNLFVVHDDLDIQLGEYKIQFGKGPKDHRGVQSVETALGTVNFWRVRIGVETRTPELRLRIPGEKYVLMRPKKDEREQLDAVVKTVSEELPGKLHANS